MLSPFFSLSFTLSLPLLTAAVAFTNPSYNGIAAGIPFTTTWSGDGTPVTILLLNGPSNNLATVLTIISNAPSSAYTWTPPSTLPPDTYAFSIIQSGNTNYSPQFPISNPTYTPSSSSPLPAPSSSSSSSSFPPSTTTPPPPPPYATSSNASAAVAYATGTGTSPPYPFSSGYMGAGDGSAGGVANSTGAAGFDKFFEGGVGARREWMMGGLWMGLGMVVVAGGWAGLMW